ncbi:hypothetical protein BLNAU_13361 [Blattamonas nauphoetae]|uniref:Uncharacterized protein n=1 Tax=Blattamonas nauphoetae TaxID=2049346 RepID=A0ABQ9XJU1_9EUKA|nr:hypothetical protein BLNAU_13361 [Blattamonas nauphoetae]
MDVFLNTSQSVSMPNRFPMMPDFHDTQISDFTGTNSPLFLVDRLYRDMLQSESAALDTGNGSSPASLHGATPTLKAIQSPFLQFTTPQTPTISRTFSATQTVHGDFQEKRPSMNISLDLPAISPTPCPPGTISLDQSSVLNVTGNIERDREQIKEENVSDGMLRDDFPPQQQRSLSPLQPSQSLPYRPSPRYMSDTELDNVDHSISIKQDSGFSLNDDPTLPTSVSPTTQPPFQVPPIGYQGEPIESLFDPLLRLYSHPPLPESVTDLPLSDAAFIFLSRFNQLSPEEKLCVLNEIRNGHMIRSDLSFFLSSFILAPPSFGSEPVPSPFDNESVPTAQFGLDQGSLDLLRTRTSDAFSDESHAFVPIAASPSHVQFDSQTSNTQPIKIRFSLNSVKHNLQFENELSHRNKHCSMPETSFLASKRARSVSPTLRTNNQVPLSMRIDQSKPLNQQCSLSLTLPPRNTIHTTQPFTKQNTSSFTTASHPPSLTLTRVPLIPNAPPNVSAYASLKVQPSSQPYTSTTPHLNTILPPAFTRHFNPTLLRFTSTPEQVHPFVNLPSIKQTEHSVVLLRKVIAELGNMFCTAITKEHQGRQTQLCLNSLSCKFHSNYDRHQSHRTLFHFHDEKSQHRSEEELKAKFKDESEAIAENPDSSFPLLVTVLHSVSVRLFCPALFDMIVDALINQSPVETLSVNFTELLRKANHRRSLLHFEYLTLLFTLHIPFTCEDTIASIFTRIKYPLTESSVSQHDFDILKLFSVFDGVLEKEREWESQMREQVRDDFVDSDDFEDSETEDSNQGEKRIRLDSHFHPTLKQPSKSSRSGSLSSKASSAQTTPAKRRRRRHCLSHRRKKKASVPPPPPPPPVKSNKKGMKGTKPKQPSSKAKSLGIVKKSVFVTSSVHRQMALNAAAALPTQIIVDGKLLTYSPSPPPVNPPSESPSPAPQAQPADTPLVINVERTGSASKEVPPSAESPLKSMSPQPFLAGVILEAPAPKQSKEEAKAETVEVSKSTSPTAKTLTPPPLPIRSHVQTRIATSETNTQPIPKESSFPVEKPSPTTVHSPVPNPISAPAPKPAKKVTFRPTKTSSKSKSSHSSRHSLAVKKPKPKTLKPRHDPSNSVLAPLSTVYQTLSTQSLLNGPNISPRRLAMLSATNRGVYANPSPQQQRPVQTGTITDSPVASVEEIETDISWLGDLNDGDGVDGEMFSPEASDDITGQGDDKTAPL